MNDLQVLTIIKTTLKKKGDGKEDNPHRKITQLWSESGQLVLEHDSYLNKTEFHEENLNINHENH